MFSVRPIDQIIRSRISYSSESWNRVLHTFESVKYVFPVSIVISGEGCEWKIMKKIPQVLLSKTYWFVYQLYSVNQASHRYPSNNLKDSRNIRGNQQKDCHWNENKNGEFTLKTFRLQKQGVNRPIFFPFIVKQSSFHLVDEALY